ncbi:MAG: hypothetical protein AAFV95_25130 [Bacteroidota bacterium]
MIRLTKSIFFLSLLLAIGACSKDDATSDDIKGVWKAISFEATASSTFQGTGSTSRINSTTVNYTVNFGDSDWTTNGGYTYTTSTTVTGFPASNSTETVSDVEGSGTYSIDGNEMTLNGSFFEFDFNGMTFNTTSGPQTANFEINSNGQLIISQDETMTSQGVSTNVTSRSIWERE